MAKLHEALKRLEKERHRLTVGAVPPPRTTGQRVWKDWFRRRAPHVADQRAEIEHLAGRLEALEAAIEGSLPTAADLMLREQIEAIARRLDTFEERVSRAIPTTDQLLRAADLVLRERVEAIARRLDAFEER